MDVFRELEFIPQWLWPFVIIWTVSWKGYALWTASQARSKYWFIVLLVVNTFGILDIIYLYFFARVFGSQAGLKKKTTSKHTKKAS